MENRGGKFIVLYGINNLGKTTQAKMLVDRLVLSGFRAEYLKYPVYELEPSGPILNNYLREGNKYALTAREAQIIYALNRAQYENTVIGKLESGINIIAEDYTGTGLAWGIGAGVDENFLKYLNSHLLKEDLTFLFDGERFKEATENGHKHETDDYLTSQVRWAHLKLGRELGWMKINANLPIDEIHGIIWRSVKEIIEPPKSWLYAPNFQKLQATERDSGQKLKVGRLSPAAKIPTRSHNGDAGLDLYADDNYTLLPGDIADIKTGIKMRIPYGSAGLIWDKSGYAKQGIHTMGGVIDSSYRGEIIVLLKNLGNDIFNIAKGQKVAQIIIQKIESPAIIEADIDDETERGQNGFGSSGIF